MIEFIKKNTIAVLRKKGYTQSQAARGARLAADRFVRGGPFNGKAVDVCLSAAIQGIGKPMGKRG